MAKIRINVHETMGDYEEDPWFHDDEFLARHEQMTNSDVQQLLKQHQRNRRKIGDWMERDGFDETKDKLDGLLKKIDHVQGLTAKDDYTLADGVEQAATLANDLIERLWGRAIIAVFVAYYRKRFDELLDEACSNAKSKAAGEIMRVILTKVDSGEPISMKLKAQHRRALLDILGDEAENVLFQYHKQLYDAELAKAETTAPKEAKVAEGAEGEITVPSARPSNNPWGKR